MPVLSLLAAYDRREGWREWGCRSCAYWLSWRCGIATLERANDHHGHPIDASTVIPQWAGETLDLGWAVTTLYYTNHRDQWARHLAQAAALRAKAHPGST